MLTLRRDLRAETGIAPLVIAAATIASSVFSRIGGLLTWGATVAWISDAVGDDDETVQPQIEEPLTNNARRYYIDNDLVNWEKAARARFTGARLSAALRAIEQGRTLLLEPDASMLTMLATMKSINVLFNELRDKELAAAKPAGAAKPTPQKPSATASPTQSWAGSAAGASSRAPAAAATSSRGQGQSVWPWAIGLGLVGVGAWMWRGRAS